eukprot:4438660-Pleurochrysis_carterae.AAC.1
MTVPAPASCSTPRIRGRSQIGAWSAILGHHAGLDGSPQSAGFSSAHGTPALWASITRSAAKTASRLCFATYLADRRGKGSTPAGALLLRRRG